MENAPYQKLSHGNENQNIMLHSLTSIKKTFSKWNFFFLFSEINSWNYICMLQNAEICVQSCLETFSLYKCHFFFKRNFSLLIFFKSLIYFFRIFSIFSTFYLQNKIQLELSNICIYICVFSMCLPNFLPQFIY